MSRHARHRHDRDAGLYPTRRSRHTQQLQLLLKALHWLVCTYYISYSLLRPALTQHSNNMHVLIIGASRNIGLLTALRLLGKCLYNIGHVLHLLIKVSSAKGDTVTLLVRSPKAFDGNEEVQKFIKSGTAHIMVGDALKEDDIRRALTANTYDAILSSLGGSALSNTQLVKQEANMLCTCSIEPVFKLPPTIEPPNICGDAMHVFLRVMRTMPEEIRSTRFIAISSSGLGRKGHEALPLVMKPLYGWFLKVPHADKLVMERLLGGAAGQPSWGEDLVQTTGEVTEQPWLNAIIIRPAFLTDGDCLGDDTKRRRSGKPPYRVGELLPSAYTVSRKDVAHFIAEEAIPHFNNYKGRAVDVGY